MKRCENVSQKDSRASPGIPPKKLNDKFRTTVSEQKINWTMPAKTEQQSQSWEKRGKLCHILNRAAKCEKQLNNVAILSICKYNQKLKKSVVSKCWKVFSATRN